MLSADLIWQSEDVRQRTLHERTRFVFVDEYHDLSPEQFRLLSCGRPRQRWQDSQVLVVADPNQAIFGFRGGDATEMLRALPGGLPANRMYELSREFPFDRAAGAIVQSPDCHPVTWRVVSAPVNPGGPAASVRHLVDRCR